MSKVAIAGNASGTGTFTIQAPNSNTDRVLSLPDEAGTVLTSGGAIDVNASAPADSVAIDASGNVGIGISSPDHSLQIERSNNDHLKLSRGSLSYELGVASTDALTFSDGGTERMRLDSSGSLLVGRSSLGYNETLSLLNSNNVSGDFSIVSFLGSNCNNTSSYHFIGNTGGADKIYIHGNGNIVNVNNSYGSLSDIKIKENITDATPKLDSLNQVRVVNYNLKDNPDQKLLGVVAQELEEIFPSMVDESPDRDTDGNILDTTTKSVKYSVFVPILIKALQEAVARIETLEAEVAALKGASA